MDKHDMVLEATENVAGSQNIVNKTTSSVQGTDIADTVADVIEGVAEVADLGIEVATDGGDFLEELLDIDDLPIAVVVGAIVAVGGVVFGIVKLVKKLRKK